MRRRYMAMMLLAIMIALCGCSNNGGNHATTSQVPSMKPENTPTPTQSVTPAETVAPTQSTAPEKKVSDYVVEETIESEAIGKNIVDEPTTRKFYVCLPPSYNDGDKRYPVVYYLHGQAEAVRNFVSNQFSTLFQEFENGAKEFIVVCVDGYSNMGGAFYVNSPVSGNWEDYVVDEVTTYIDQKYRTIDKRDSRGICGFSMGGFGAYNLAFRHPDKYCCVLAMSPGALADDDMESAMKTWQYDTSFLTGYGRAFSPNAEATDKKYANIPVLDNSKEDNEIVKDWYSGFGDLKEKVDAYVALNTPLKAIEIIYGETDAYDWIPRGCEFLAKCMDDKNVDYVMETHKLGHMMPIGAAENYIVPFFTTNLEY